MPGQEPIVKDRDQYPADYRYQAEATPPIAEAPQPFPEPKRAPAPRQAGAKKLMKHEAASRLQKGRILIPSAAKPLLFVIIILLLAAVAYFLLRPYQKPVEPKPATQPADKQEGEIRTPALPMPKDHKIHIHRV